MKKITINLLKNNLKKQIEALAKLAAKENSTRYYLHYLQFEKIEGGLRVSVTNGFTMSDILIESELLEIDLEIGEKVHLASKAFLKLESKDILKIEIEEKAAIINGLQIANVLKEGYPQIDRIRIKSTENSVSVFFNAKMLKQIADTFENDEVELFFDPEYPAKPIFVKGKESSGVLMPLRKI